jgi:hypothetical protein
MLVIAVEVLTTGMKHTVLSLWLRNARGLVNLQRFTRHTRTNVAAISEVVYRSTYCLDLTAHTE